MIRSGPVPGANSSGLAMSGGCLSLQGLARLNGFELSNAFYHDAPQINQISRLGVSVLFKLRKHRAKRFDYFAGWGSKNHLTPPSGTMRLARSEEV
jgi:hypothetical protein